MLANLAVKKETMKEVADRHFTSNDMEKVLEFQNSAMFRRRVPAFPYPEYPVPRFHRGPLGLYPEDLEPHHAEEQQKMLQNLLKHYQKSLMEDWGAAVQQQLPKKEVEETKEEPRVKRGRREEDGKGFSSKQRKTNFTGNEVETLLNCVRNMKDVILFGVAGGRGWARAWQDIAKIVTKVEGIQRSEGDVRKKWTYLKWEAKNTSKPGRDPVSKQVLNILTSRDREVHEAMTMREQKDRMEEEDKVPPVQPGLQSPLQPIQNARQQTPQPSSPPPAMPIKKQSLPPLAPKPLVKQLPAASSTVKPPPKLLPKPSSPPEVCLRWNSYHSNMQNTFPSLLYNEQFVDVTLACDGRSIKCHKMMLSACSPYMEELLSSNPCQHPIILLKDMKFWQLQALVDFMYRGEVNVTQDKLPSLLSAAEALQIKGLASPVNHSGPPKITQVQSVATPSHEISTDDMDQVTYMRHLQLQSDTKAEMDEDYLQDTDESQPPTPKAKKRKLGQPSNGTAVKQSPGSGKKKERHEKETAHTQTERGSGPSEHKRMRESSKMSSNAVESKSFTDDARQDGNPDEDLDIDEEQAQIILERYSAQTDDYSRGADDIDDNSTTSG